MDISVVELEKLEGSGEPTEKGLIAQLHGMVMEVTEEVTTLPVERCEFDELWSMDSASARLNGMMFLAWGLWSHDISHALSLFRYSLP